MLLKVFGISKDKTIGISISILVLIDSRFTLYASKKFCAKNFSVFTIAFTIEGLRENHRSGKTICIYKGFHLVFEVCAKTIPRCRFAPK